MNTDCTHSTRISPFDELTDESRCTILRELIRQRDEETEPDQIAACDRVAIKLLKAFFSSPHPGHAIT